MDRYSLFTRFHDDAVTVARRLLGQRLVRMERGRRLSGIIVEVEAYAGIEDRASHSFGGRRTARNASMFLPNGHAYVYLIYGVHHCLNVVCGPDGEAAAVLIRALRPEEGIDVMRSRRPGASRTTQLCSGPGKLAQALGIDRRLDGLRLDGSGPLFVEAPRRRALPGPAIVATPRIGVERAGVWARRPLRFFVRDDPNVSRSSR